MSTNTTKKMQVFGLKGKSAYEYAQEGGYTGTEEEFRAKLAEDMTEEKIIDLLTETGIISPVVNSDGKFYTNTNDDIYVL